MRLNKKFWLTYTDCHSWNVDGLWVFVTEAQIAAPSEFKGRKVWRYAVSEHKDNKVWRDRNPNSRMPETHFFSSHEAARHAAMIEVDRLKDEISNRGALTPGHHLLGTL